MFAQNEGSFDRLIRSVLGAGLLVLALTVLPNVWMWVAGVVGVVLLVTGLTGRCPLYKLLGISTCPVRVQSK